MYREHDNKSVISGAGSILLTLLTGFVAWFPAFWLKHTPLYTQGGGTLYRVLTPVLEQTAPYTPLIALVVSFIMGIVLCCRSANLRLVKTTSLLPILFTVLLTGIFTSEHGVSPGLLATLCVYIAFSKLVTPCHYDDAMWYMLETGFFVSLATLFAPTYIFYLPICWIGMQLFNHLRSPHLLALTIGFIIPYLLGYGFWFLTDNTALITYQWNVLSHQFCIEWLWSMHETILLIILGLTLLVALVAFLRQHSDRIHPRAVSSLCFLWAFTALLLSFLYHNAHHTPTLVLFASLLLTQYFHIRSKKLTRVFFYTLIASILFVYLTQFAA